jgi:hypothetical protein
MKKKRSNAAYLILVLLILLVVAIIGALSVVLFNIGLPPSPHTQGGLGTQTNVLINAVDAIVPVAEMRIEIPPEVIPEARVGPTPADTGVIPTVCDGLGAQIQQRKAYWGPTTYEANVLPNRVRFTINIPDIRPTAGPNNTR